MTTCCPFFPHPWIRYTGVKLALAYELLLPCVPRNIQCSKGSGEELEGVRVGISFPQSKPGEPGKSRAAPGLPLE